jgi:L-ascorbate metabolism protein UlaG (beta-lactamase superfamily)
MKGVTSLVLALALVPMAARAQNNTIPADEGPITFTAIQHASVQVEWSGRVIQVDPAQGDFSRAKPADMVILTDIHGDHLNTDIVARIRKSGGPVVMPEAVRAQVGDKIPGPIQVMENGQKKEIFSIPIEAVPMYNLTRGPSAGQFFHTKGRGNGYVLTMGGKRVYFAGDTECTPEMKALKNIDVAFLPMNLPYTMTPVEAADCAKVFKPKIVYPYHYQGQKPEEFEAALKGSGIEVRMLNWYPPASAGK